MGLERDDVNRIIRAIENYSKKIVIVAALPGAEITQDSAEIIQDDSRQRKSSIDAALLKIINLQYPQLNQSQITDNLEKVIRLEPSFYNSVIDAQKIYQIVDKVIVMSNINIITTAAVCPFWKTTQDVVDQSPNQQQGMVPASPAP